MIEIFLEATDFANLFENIEEEKPSAVVAEDPVESQTAEGAEAAPGNKPAANAPVVKYWEKVFANATTDAHKLFKSQKNKMYIESFEEHLRKILRYRNTTRHSSDNKFRMDGNQFKYDYNDFIVILYEDIIEDYKASKKFKGKLSLEKVMTMGFWCFNAGNSFRQILSLKPRSLILTSGTLTPMECFEKEL